MLAERFLNVTDERLDNVYRKLQMYVIRVTTYERYWRMS